jgi:hypothetical protein
LPEENRPGGIQADQDGNRDHDRQNEQQGETGYHQIKRTLCDTLGGGERHLAKHHHPGRLQLSRWRLPKVGDAFAADQTN